MLKIKKNECEVCTYVICFLCVFINKEKNLIKTIQTQEYGNFLTK